jgi:hypothetical protein
MPPNAELLLCFPRRKLQAPCGKAAGGADLESVAATEGAEVKSAQ